MREELERTGLFPRCRHPYTPDNQYSWHKNGAKRPTIICRICHLASKKRSDAAKNPPKLLPGASESPPPKEKGIPAGPRYTFMKLRW